MCYEVTLREDDEILVRSNQVFRGEAAVPAGLDLPKVPTHRMLLSYEPEGFLWFFKLTM